ncbi:uncharacterized protein CTRU02_215653 [Colletotrichum truncatum]|uniref:Uncharacterized protein n=1 Tax=Colletotrichum truncatum TaxID=5467 RepID=A0ACC3YCH9_COLTU
MLSTTRFNVIIASIVATASFTYGFGFASFATAIGQPGFYEYFQLPTKGPGATHTNSIIGTINALFFSGAVIGACSIGPLADRYGRRKSLVLGALVSAFGAALTAGSQSVSMLLVARIIQGAGLGSLACLSPTYLTEISTPQKRGMVTGMHGIFLVFGYNVSAWVGFACHFSSNFNFGFRGPLGFTALPAVLLAIGCLWIPESPRWLLARGLPDEARLVLQRLHTREGDSDKRGFELEVARLEKQVALETKIPGGYRIIFQTAAYRRRALLSCFIQFAANASGALFISYYSVLIYQNLGLDGYIPLLMYCIFTLVGAIGNVVSALFIDRLGRRPSLIIGFAGCLIAISIETAMIAEFIEGPIKSATGQRIALVAIFVLFYGAFIDAASFVYSAEIYPTNIRSRGVALATCTYFIACIIFVTPGATAIATIGWKYFLVFIVLTIAAIAILCKA